MQYIDIFSFLKDNNIVYQTYTHKPVFTVEEALQYVPDLPAKRTKNLFLRDKSGKRHVLLMMPHQKPLNLRKFAQDHGFKNLSFASTERLNKFLGVDPGAVSILGLINDSEHTVEVYIDEALWAAEALACHPLRNDMTLVIPVRDIRRILKILDYTVHVIKIEN